MRQPLFFDIETNGLHPYIHRVVAIVSQVGADEEPVVHLDIDEKKLLEAFMERLKLVQKNVFLIGYNSNNFDWKFIFTRCLKNGVDYSPLKFSRHLDMMYSIKGYLFNSQLKMTTVCNKLGIQDDDKITGKDVPGLWEQYEKMNGDLILQDVADSIAKAIVDHCKWDVQNLVDLYKKVKPFVDFEYSKRYFDKE